MTDEREGLPSASTAERTKHCPGWPALAARVPELPSDTSLRDQGTVGHQWLEDGKFPEGVDDDELLALVQECREIELAQAVGFELDSRERRFWVKKDGTKIYSGKPDAVYRYKHKGLIVDYKLGYAGADHADSNLQMRANAAAVALNSQQVFGCETHEIKSIDVILIHPRCNPKYTRASYNQQDIQRAIAATERIMTDSSLRIQPGKWCNYCPARGSCQARMLSLHWDTRTEIDFTSITNPILAEMYERSRLATKIVEDVKTEMKRRIRECEIDGYALQPTGATSKVTDVKEFAGRLRRAHPTIDAWTALSTSKTLVEAALKKDGYKGVCLKEAMDNLFDGIVEMKEKEPKIVKVK